VTARIVPAGPETINAAASVIRGGGLVISPTVTNYNVLCDATSTGAVDRVFQAKKRVKLGPLPVSLPYPADIPRYVHVPDTFDKAAFNALLPGEVSFIFWQRYPFPEQLTCGLHTVAVSCTSDPVMRAIVKGVGGPVAATSANLSGQGNIFVSLDKAVADLGDAVDLVVDGGETAAAASPDHTDRVNTIIDLTFDRPWLCRRGWVPIEAVEKYVPDLETDIDAYRNMLARRVGSPPTR
jgi:L-threonylcarbamoyladenylate synthase